RRRAKPGRSAGLSFAVGRPALLRGRVLEMVLERLAGFLGEAGIEFAKLGALRQEAIVGALEVAGLHCDGGFERPCADELLGRRRAVLECLLGIVRDLGRNRLDALGEGAERLQRRLDIVPAELLHLFQRPNHWLPFPAGPAAIVSPRVRRKAGTAPAFRSYIVHRTKVSSA